MATYTVGYKIWDSQTFLACCSAGESGTGNPSTPVMCGEGWNPRGAQLVPFINCDEGTVRWDLWDNVIEYTSVEGARNGIAVTDPVSGVITLWDVSGTANSGAGDDVSDKMLNFLPICNCTDCTGDLEVLQGQYECDYPEFATAEYCYDVTFTENDGRQLSLTNIAMKYQAYLVGYPMQTSHVAGSTTTVYRICLNRPIAEVGKLPNSTWVLV